MTPDRHDHDDQSDVPDPPASGGTPRGDSEIDAEFERIVAGWEATGESRWRHEPPPPEPVADAVEEPAEEPEPSEVLAAHDAVELAESEDHYVPPEPPPFPRPTPAILGAAALVTLGIVLIAWPSLIGLSTRYGLPLGLISFSGAVVWLIAHLRQGPPEDGWDDGAQV